jgi:hypothetical protein
MKSRGTNVAKTTRNYILCVCIGLVLGIAGCYFVAKGQFDKRFNAISNDLTTSQNLNNELRASNTELQSANSRSTATAKRLQGQIDADNSRFNATINGLKIAIGQTAAGLGQATDALQGVIDGIESLKSLIRSLP